VHLFGNVNVCLDFEGSTGPSKVRDLAQ